jgi:hypothetical protein
MNYLIREAWSYVLVSLVGLFCGAYLGLSVSKEHYDRKLSECENSKINDDIVVSKTALDILKTYQDLYYKTKETLAINDTIHETFAINDTIHDTVVKIKKVYIVKEAFKSNMPSTILFKKE